jgi:hypothetical protein
LIINEPTIAGLSVQLENMLKLENFREIVLIKALKPQTLSIE